MKSQWLWLILVLVGLGVAAGGWFWYTMQQPLYRPGMVRAGKNLRAPLTPPAQGTDPVFWQVEPDMQLYHTDVGTGRNVLVVHGGPGVPYAEPWPALAPLRNDYRFHFYDQRGAGQSTRPFDRFAGGNFYRNMTTLEQTLGIGAQLADIERIRQILGDEKLILMGHSWGAFLATLYAAEFPEHVETLILLAPADMLVMPQPRPDLFAAVRERLPASMWADYDAYMAAYLDFGNLFTKAETDLQAANRQFAAYYSRAVGQELTHETEVGGWMAHAMYFSIGRRHDYRAVLREITAQTLVLHGADDLQSEAVSQEYVDLLPQANLTVIPGADHFLFTSQPAAFAETLQTFLEQ